MSKRLSIYDRLPEAPARESMPVHRLLIQWWGGEPPASSRKAREYREALYEACLAEIRLKASYGINYDPGVDHRVKWAAQWLEVGEGTRKRVDCGIAAAAEMILDPAPYALSGKDFAAGMAFD